MTVISNDCGLKWLWSQMNVVSCEWGLKWIRCQMNMALNECCLKWTGLKWMWSQMNRSQMNVVSNEQVSYECGLKWTGLKWTWSQMNGLKWIGLNCLNTIKTSKNPPVPTQNNLDFKLAASRPILLQLDRIKTR